MIDAINERRIRLEIERLEELIMKRERFDTEAWNELVKNQEFLRSLLPGESR